MYHKQIMSMFYHASHMGLVQFKTPMKWWDAASKCEHREETAWQTTLLEPARCRVPMVPSEFSMGLRWDFGGIWVKHGQCQTTSRSTMWDQLGVAWFYDLTSCWRLSCKGTYWNMRYFSGPLCGDKNYDKSRVFEGFWVTAGCDIWVGFEYICINIYGCTIVYGCTVGQKHASIIIIIYVPD